MNSDAQLRIGQSLDFRIAALRAAS